MGDYLKRVIEEKAELDKKRERLAAFIGSSLFGKLPMEECNRLRLQQITMDNYSTILGDRIEASPSKASPLTGGGPLEREAASLLGEADGLRDRMGCLLAEMGKIEEASADLKQRAEKFFVRRMENLLARLSRGAG
jgi:hypothetical protein